MIIASPPWHKQDIQFPYEASWVSFWTGSFYKSVKVDDEWSTFVAPMFYCRNFVCKTKRIRVIKKGLLS